MDAPKREKGMKATMAKAKAKGRSFLLKHIWGGELLEGGKCGGKRMEL
jgi:hypothetical protein